MLNETASKQSAGVKLIEADRHNLGDILKNHHFDIVVTAYSSKDVGLLLSIRCVAMMIIYSLAQVLVYQNWCKQPLQKTASWVLISIGEIRNR